MKNRNRVILILSIALFLVAITFLILGFAIAGNDVIAWFGSKWAIWFYVFIGVYIIVVAGVFISERIKNL